MHTVLLDIREKDPTMEKFLGKQLTVVPYDLVHQGLADVAWRTNDKLITGEHKTIEQLLSEMGGRLDDQLRRYTNHADEVFLAIDGLATPVPGQPACYIWTQHSNGQVFHKKRVSRRRGEDAYKVYRSWEELQAYIYSLDKMGITTYIAPTTESLCLAISSYVYNSMKDEHRSLQRYNKTRPILWQPDPYVSNLMGLLYQNGNGVNQVGIGETRAKQVLEVYKTPWRVIQSSFDSKWPLGKETWLRLMQAFGRNTG